VLLALEIEGVSRVGAVCLPALNEVLCAADGLGCWWNDKQTRVSEVTNLKQSVFTYTSWSGFRTRKRLPVFENLHKECFFGRSWGDAYGYHMVATGRAELMLDPTASIWDVAPYPPIFREAEAFSGEAGEEGHTHGEDCLRRAQDKFLELIRGE
jgi:myo-inositol-1(or 4)-monophosphatase